MTTDNPSSTPPEVSDYPVDDLPAAAWIAAHGQRGLVTSDAAQHYTWWFADTPEVRALHEQYRNNTELHRWHAAMRVLRRAGNAEWQRMQSEMPDDQWYALAIQEENRRRREIAGTISPGILSRQRARAAADRAELTSRLDAVRRAQHQASQNGDDDATGGE